MNPSIGMKFHITRIGQTNDAACIDGTFDLEKRIRETVARSMGTLPPGTFRLLDVEVSIIVSAVGKDGP